MKNFNKFSPGAFTHLQLRHLRPAWPAALRLGGAAAAPRRAQGFAEFLESAGMALLRRSYYGRPFWDVFRWAARMRSVLIELCIGKASMSWSPKDIHSSWSTWNAEWPQGFNVKTGFVCLFVCVTFGLAKRPLLGFYRFFFQAASFIVESRVEVPTAAGILLWCSESRQQKCPLG